jgi:hypothetical protein
VAATPQRAGGGAADAAAGRRDEAAIAEGVIRWLWACTAAGNTSRTRDRFRSDPRLCAADKIEL